MRNSVYFNVKNDEDYRTSTGLTLEQFNLLFEEFSRHYKIPSREHIKGAMPELILSDAREALFFILYHLKTDSKFGILGLSFGMSKGSAHKNVNRIKPYLKLSLQHQQVLPKRLFSSVEVFEQYFEGIEDLCIDATEIPIERPKNKENQYNSFSVKQHQNGVKNTIISDKSHYIHFLGATTPAGRTHDFQLLKNDFNPDGNFFRNKHIKIDTGYTGFDKDYTTKKTDIPYKKPRKSKSNPHPTLTEEKKKYNREISKERVVVENAIGGMKRYDILQHSMRVKNMEKRDNMIELCAGLWNFKVRNREKTA